METNFKSYLSKAGLSEAVIAVLEEEVVVTFVIFQSLREEHFERPANNSHRVRACVMYVRACVAYVRACV